MIPDTTFHPENINGWTELAAECYGADIYEPTPATTLEDCKRGCEAYEGCTFITFGKSDSSYAARCIYKNGKTSGYSCNGCNDDGTCGMSTSCNPRTQYCSTNVLTDENMADDTMVSVTTSVSVDTMNPETTAVS